jgi:hypothetical protein
MMNRRYTLILLVVLGALVAYTYFTEFRKDEEEEAPSPLSDQPIVFDLAEEEIVSLKVTTDEGQVTELKHEGEAWVMVTPASEEVDETRVSSLVRRLADLKASRVITQTADIAQYGLITGTLTADITLSDGTTHELLVGETNPAGAAYYALADGNQDSVYLLFSGIVDDLKRLVSEPPYPPTPTPTVEPSPTIEVLPSVTPTQ